MYARGPDVKTDSEIFELLVKQHVKNMNTATSDTNIYRKPLKNHKTLAGHNKVSTSGTRSRV